MRLSDLNRFQQIVIQTHDNPDADAVGSGYALYRYFKSKGKSVRLVYGGRNEVTKSNMKLMISQLEIPLEYIDALPAPELLITVDCQYGEANVTRFEAENAAVIDHHDTGMLSGEFSEIRADMVSCATLVYSLLLEEKFDVNSDVKIATALYYGLYMDSKQLSEISHPLDLDMIDRLQYDKALISRLKYANYDINEMLTAGRAICSSEVIAEHSLMLVKAEPCDPNILGVISDFVIQVDSVSVCVVYNEIGEGYKLSVRSSTPEVAANDFADFITKGCGNGGGHRAKAGGFISRSKISLQYGDKDMGEYLTEKINSYYSAYDVIRYTDPISDGEKLHRYRKRPVVCGYVRSCELFGENAKIKLRTLEGDVSITTRRDIYIMIGINGEIYPIEENIFNEKYSPELGSYEGRFDYLPTVIDLADGSTCELLPHASRCRAKTCAEVCARPLEKYTKVFTAWDYDGYMAGKAGDILCYTEGRSRDVYVVRGDMFDDLYEEI